MATGFVIVSEDSLRCVDYTGGEESLQAAKDLGQKVFTLFATMHAMGLPKINTVTVDFQKGLLLLSAKDGTIHSITVDMYYPDISHRSVLEFVQQTWLYNYSIAYARSIEGQSL